MDRGYDIFEKFPDGSAQRHANSANLENAIAKTNALAKLSPNEFYILSTDTQEIVHPCQASRSLTMKRAPQPGMLSAQILPPKVSTSCRLIARPSPAPPCNRVDADPI